jgi:oxidase EvaA
MNKRPLKRIKFTEQNDWIRGKYKIYHKSKRFFSIIFVKSNQIEKVLIDQREIGILGIIVAKSTKENFFLLQKKEEPGNIKFMQIAPTLQATKSNYERVHAGKSSEYLDFFKKKGVLQSEQGDKFYGKFNRNIINIVTKKIPIKNKKKFFWCSIDKIKYLLRTNYSLNTDARSVLASGQWSLLSKNPQKIFLESSLSLRKRSAFNLSYKSTIRDDKKFYCNFLSNLYDKRKINYKKISLNNVKSFRFSEDGIYDIHNRRCVGFFDCYFPSREIPRWQQPLLESKSEPTFLLLFKIHKGIALFLIQASIEIGFLDHCEFGPLKFSNSEILCKEGSYNNFFKKKDLLIKIRQSDEGGRFYQNISNYIIAEIKEETAIASLPNTFWISLAQLEDFSSNSGMLTNEMRTLISMLLFFA